MKKICTTCGNNIDNKSSFCKVCGSPIDREVEVKEATNKKEDKKEKVNVNPLIVNIICLLIGFFCPALSIIFLFFFGIRYIRYIKPIGYGIFLRFIVIVISAVLANI